MTSLLWSANGAARDRQATDGELVSRFALDQDEAAFRELVRRLGPVVYGICRRHLGETGDAEDAFQATFLVLARKAGTLRQPGRVAAWLHGVAGLAARKLREARRRRERRIAPTHPLPERPTSETPATPNASDQVEDELSRLPDRLRLPILLCGVRGLTVAQAAAELGWPVGTVASRLSRGRAHLTRRLTARGVAGLGVAASGAGLNASVPVSLVELTGSAGIGATQSPAVSALTTEVSNTMMWSPFRRLAAGLLVASSVSLFGGGLLVTPGQAAPVPVAPAPDKPAALDRVPWEGIAGLLRQESVRKEVGLGDDDYKAFVANFKGGRVALQMRLEADLKARGPAATDAILQFEQTYQADLRDLEIELGKKLAEGLKPAGARRLKQAILQSTGPWGLLDRVAIRELQLTAEQEDKIAAVIGLSPRTIIGGVILNATLDKVAAQRDTTMEKALKELTAEQRKRWSALVGAPLPTADLLKAHQMSEESLMEMVGDTAGNGGPAVPPPPPPPVEKS